MQQIINKDNVYPFRFKGGEQSLYEFDTDNVISYDVRFKPCDYIFEGRVDFHVPTFELTIEVAVNETGKKPPLDPKIPFTIASIFADFYQKNDRQVIIFICDSSDRKQEVRRRKFNQWVEFFKGNEYVKFDTEIIDPIGSTYYNSIILKTDNPYRDQIIQSFIDLADDYKK
jgi:Family of unknown function (DUF6169)